MIEILKGYAAIKIGKYWVGVVAGNKYCQNRRTSEKALEDAKKVLDKTNNVD